MELLLLIDRHDAGRLEIEKALRRKPVPAGQAALDFDTPANGGEGVDVSRLFAGTAPQPPTLKTPGLFDETAHPRVPAGHEHGGEFARKTAPAAATVLKDQQAALEALRQRSESLKPGDPNYKYRDTGYVPGARKELAAAWIRQRAKDGEQVTSAGVDWGQLEENPREAAQIITKANVFGEVDWEALREKGMSPGAAYLVSQVYAAVASKPEDDAQARRDYVSGCENLRLRMEGCNQQSDVLDALHDIGKEMRGVRYTDAERNELNGVQSEAFFIKKRSIGLDENSPEFQAHREKIDAINAVIRRVNKAARDRNREQNPLSAAFDALGDRFGKLPLWMRYGGAFAAAVHRSQLYERRNDWSWLEEPGAKRKGGGTRRPIPVFQLKVADRVERIGGRPFKADSTAGLKSQFGLRDVQTGNYVAQDVKAAQFHVEQASMALSDLADVLGVTDADVGFNHRLALAFGARGQGGANAAMAHYESVHRIINLTKFNGGGCLAHEWWHAFDNLIFEPLGAKSGANSYASAATGQLPSGPVRTAYEALRTAMLQGKFLEGARELDRLYSSKPYWSTPDEMSARAFAAFVQDRLETRDQANTYLVTKTTNKDYEGEKAVPYPGGAQREQINAAFDQLFAAVKAENLIQKSLALRIRLDR